MHRLVAATLASCDLSVLVSAQAVSNADVEAAIRVGRTRKFDTLVSDGVATAGFGEGMAANMAGGPQRIGSFQVVVSRNAGRIAYLAAEAQRLYKPFTRADISEELLVPGVCVFVEPNEPTRPTGTNPTIGYAAPIDRVALKSQGKPEVVAQPESFETEPVEWSNLMGGKIASTRALARFAPTAFAEMPPGDVDVVVVTQAGERRCKVGTKDRARLFGSKPATEQEADASTR